MKAYSLQFKSREFEQAFFENDGIAKQWLLKLGAASNFLQCGVLLVFFLFMKRNINIGDISIIAAYFILAMFSYIIKYTQKRSILFQNMFFFIKNIAACLIIGISGFLRKDKSSVDTDFINYQPLLGMLLSIELFCSTQGTHFILKSISCFINIAFYSIALYADNSAGLITAVSIGTLYSIIHFYVDERLKRRLFMDKQRSIELQFLIDKLLPINVIVTKYNPKEERTFLHEVNRKAQNSFQITDNDSFKEFSKRIIIAPDHQSNDSFHQTQQVPSESESDQEDNKTKIESQRTLFFYMESIAKENFQRQKEAEQQKEKNLSNPLKKMNTRQFQKRGSITKLQKIKCNDNFSLKDKKSNNDYHRPKLISLDVQGLQSPIPISPSKYKHQYQSSLFAENANQNNQLHQSILNPVGNLSNNAMNASHEFFHQEINSKNNNLIDSDKERNVRFSFDPENQQKQKRSQPPIKNELIKRFSFSSQTVNEKLSMNLSGSHYQLKDPPLSVTKLTTLNNVGNSKQMRRGLKKNTVLRKVSNFNLRAGMANKKIKYCEDVYDRIDVLAGLYTDLKGQKRQIQIKIYTYNVSEQYQVILIEDETLVGQVKYLQELNRFLYRSFTDSLEQFRMPLAYSLLKLGKAYELQKQPNDNNISQALTGYSLDMKIESGSKEFHSNQSTFPLIFANPNQITQPTTANANTVTTNQNMGSSMTLIHAASQTMIKQPGGQAQSELLPFLSVSPGKGQGSIPLTKAVSNPPLFSGISKDEESSLILGFDIPQNSHSQWRERLNSNAYSTLCDSLENSRYYGFLTLNSIYNYIDYINLLQQL